MNLKKVDAETAKSVLRDIQVSEPAKELLTDAIGPAAYLEALVENGLYQDAVQFLARALPRREATWWACLSARYSVTDDTPVEQSNLLELTEAWVYKPTDEARYQINERVQHVPDNSPIHWSAMASFWSGGSLASPELAEVPPAAHICGLAVAGAITLVAVSGDEAEEKARYNFFIKQGIAIANGKNAKEVTV